MKTNEVAIEGLDKVILEGDLSKPIQDLFDECLNFITKSAFEI